MASALWSIYNDLVPMRGRVEETKANLFVYQQSALNLLNSFATDIAAFQSYESPMLTRYLQNIEAATKSGMSGERLVSIVQSFAAPSTQAAPMYSTKMSEMSRLHSEFNAQIREYHAAVTAMNNRKRLFPGSLFAGEFFEVPEATYLQADESQLLPPRLVAAHLEQVRKITFPSADSKQATTTP
jgi:hypothetical protein